MDLAIIEWHHRLGYNIIIATENFRKTLDQEFLQLVFFKALGAMERRFEPRLWIQEYKGEQIACYYPGELSGRKIMVLSKDKSRKIAKIVAIDVVMKIRQYGVENISSIITPEYVSLIRSMDEEKIPLFVFSEEVKIRLYDLLIKNPVILFNDLVDMLMTTNSTSASNIKDILRMFNITGFVDIKYIEGEEVITLNKVFVGTRRFNKRIITKFPEMKNEVKEYVSAYELSKELLHAARCLLIDKYRSFLEYATKTDKINTAIFREEVLEYMKKLRYIIMVSEKEAILVSIPIIKEYDIMTGEKIKEYTISSFPLT